MSSSPQIVPYFSYVDGRAAIAFLTTAFGFETVQAHDGPDGRLSHAELRYGSGVVMMGSVDAAPAVQSPGVYVVVEDVDAHHRRAVAAGAAIVYPPESTEWGTKRYRARDPEGHEWSFGTYAPSTQPPSWAS